MMIDCPTILMWLASMLVIMIQRDSYWLRIWWPAALIGEKSGAVAELKQLFALAESYGIQDWLRFDASVVRGLAYYTGTVFEVRFHRPDSPVYKALPSFWTSYGGSYIHQAHYYYSIIVNVKDGPSLCWWETILQGFDKEKKLRAICGGGRYDRLLSTYGGPEMAACGFGFGDAVIVEVRKDLHVYQSRLLYHHL